MKTLSTAWKIFILATAFLGCGAVALAVSPKVRFWSKEIVVEPIECIAKIGFAKCTYDRPVDPESKITRNILEAMGKEN